MTTPALLERLDSLDHNERLQQLIQHARGLNAESRAALLSSLQQGDTHSRWLGIQAAGHSGEFDSLWEGLKDPSVMIRSLSAAFIGRGAREIEISILESLDSSSLGVLYSRLMQRQDPSVSEPLVQTLIAHDRLGEAAALLCSCSDEFILARLKSVAWPEHTWTKLAKSRSHLFLKRVEDEFLVGTRPEFIWQRYSSVVWALLCDFQPAAVCDWVERFSDADTLPAQLRDGLPALLRHDITRVVGWFAARGGWFASQRFPAGLARSARNADPVVLVELSKSLIFTSQEKFAELISCMPYSLRAQLFEAATAQLETKNTEWSFELLSVLPRRVRDREAARMLALPRAKTDGWWRRRLYGMRDIELVRELLQAESTSAQAEERGEAHAALVRATFDSGKGIELTLARLAQTKNEQDPVRSAFLSALAEVPGHYFQDSKALDAVVSPSFEARDVSYQTRAAILRIAHRLMTAQATSPAGPMFRFAITLLERLAGHQGTPDFPRLYPNLPLGGERSIFLALKPWIQAAKSRQQAAHVFALWRALGERAWRVPEFGELIGDMIWSGNKNHASAAVACWLEDPKTRDQRAAELVARDVSALYLNQVVQHAHQRRQTWLSKRFNTAPPKGRFHDGKVAYVPSFTTGFWRWPSALQRSYVALIRRVEVDSTQYMATRAGLIARRARVPISRVEDFSAELASTQVVIQEAALGAIVWTDCPEGALPILLEHLDGDRARVAMYAMPRLARLIPRTEFVHALSGLLESGPLKVTVHKEVVRLLGQAGTTEAVELLGREWGKTLHRDVRIAALHAARSLLNREEAWAILQTGATSEVPDVAMAIVRVPMGTVAARHRRRYLDLMVIGADHEAPEVRAALFAALRWGWMAVDLQLILDVAARVITRLDESDPWHAALSAVAGSGRSTTEHAQVLGLIEELVLMAQDATPAGTRDQMAHQRLVAVLDVLKADRHPDNLLLLTQVASFLRKDLDWWGHGAAMAICACKNASLADVVIELVLSAPTPLSLRAVLPAATTEAESTLRGWTSEDALSVVQGICMGSGLARLVAVDLVAVFGPQFGWGEAWMTRIGLLRNDDDIDVRTSARAVWIAEA